MKSCVGARSRFAADCIPPRRGRRGWTFSDGSEGRSQISRRNRPARALYVNTQHPNTTFIQVCRTLFRTRKRARTDVAVILSVEGGLELIDIGCSHSGLDVSYPGNFRHFLHLQNCPRIRGKYMDQPMVQWTVGIVWGRRPTVVLLSNHKRNAGRVEWSQTSFRRLGRNLH